MEYGPQACGLCHSRSISFPLPFPGAICLGRCAYICGDIPQITTNSTEKRASRASAQRSDSWCPTLSAPPIGPALPPDSSRWSPFIILYVCMYVSQGNCSLLFRLGQTKCAVIITTYIVLVSFRPGQKSTCFSVINTLDLQS